jgi:ABC-type glycerol-3-phosphate transport system substrate-binding protein
MYVDGASVLFTPQGALGLPVSVEPMVLFYNRDLLSKHGIPNPPTYWGDITAMSSMLTIFDKAGNVAESAIALGSPDVPYAKDIIMAIIGQLGQVPVVRIPNQLGELYFDILANQPVTEGGDVLPLSTTLRYYTQFADPGQKAFSWKEGFPNAVDTFLSEKLAMYIGYSGEYQLLRARNPRASIEMTYLPQTQGYNTFSTGMRMYALATLKSSKNPYVALTVESQFAGAGIAPVIAQITGGVPALRSYAMTQGLDPVIAKSMLVARGWYDSHPVETTGYTTVMISDVNNRRYNISDAANIFVSRLRDLYTKK